MPGAAHLRHRALFVADATAEIAQLEQLLNSATKSVATDGLRTDFDLEQARKRLNELRLQQSGATGRKRPPFVAIRLGGAW